MCFATTFHAECHGTNKCSAKFARVHQGQLSIQDIGCAYILFKALTNEDSQDSAQNCRACGYHSTVQIFDTNQKICFKLDEEDLKSQRTGDSSNGSGDDDNEVNTEEF